MGCVQTQSRPTKHLTVCVTGAAGNIGYAFVPLVANGSVFGHDTKIDLNLLDIDKAQQKLKGIALELEDGGYSTLGKVQYSDDPKIAFKDCDVVVFIGGFPRQKGQERKDLLKINGGIFSAQGKALEEVGKTTTRCLVVANPANTNCWILKQNCPKIPEKNFSCLTRLDENRAVSQIAKKAGVDVDLVSDVFIWGNHSKTQYPDVTHGKAGDKTISEAINDQKYLQEEFVKKVQNRGGEILEQTGLTSIFSAANAVKDHLRDWYRGSSHNHSQGCFSNGEYGVPKGMMFSFPVKYEGNWEYKIVDGFTHSEFCKAKIQETTAELQDEQKDYLEITKAA